MYRVFSLDPAIPFAVALVNFLWGIVGSLVAPEISAAHSRYEEISVWLGLAVVAAATYYVRAIGLGLAAIEAPEIARRTKLFRFLVVAPLVVSAGAFAVHLLLPAAHYSYSSVEAQSGQLYFVLLAVSALSVVLIAQLAVLCYVPWFLKRGLDSVLKRIGRRIDWVWVILALVFFLPLGIWLIQKELNAIAVAFEDRLKASSTSCGPDVRPGL